MSMEGLRCTQNVNLDLKLKCKYTMEYYSILERKRIITDVTTSMNLEDVMINEIWQLQKDLGSHLYEMPRVIKLIGQRLQ